MVVKEKTTNTKWRHNTHNQAKWHHKIPQNFLYIFRGPHGTFNPNFYS